MQRRGYQKIGNPNAKYQMLNGSSGMSFGAQVLVALLVAAIAAAALVVGGIALARLNAGTFSTVKITDTFDLSMAQLVNDQSFFEQLETTAAPTSAPARRAIGERSVLTDITLGSGKRKVILDGGAYRLNIPTNLRKYRNKLYTIYSGNNETHEISLNPSINDPEDDDDNDYPNHARGMRCRNSVTPGAFWDKKWRYRVAQFDGRIGCYMVFEIIDCQTLVVHESRGVRYCTPDLTECVDDFTIESECPDTPTVINVGPTRRYKQVQDVLDTFSGRHICSDTEIKIDAGVYEGFAVGDDSSSGLAYRSNTRGLSIVGDERQIVGQTYINGQPLIANAASAAIVGDVGEIITFSHPGGDLSKLLVTTGGSSQPDFVAAGLTAGDRVVLTYGVDNIPVAGPVLPDSIGFNEVAVIQSVSANELTFTAPISEAIDVLDTVLVILPNVRVQNKPGSLSMSVNNAGVAVQGVLFEPSAGTPPFSMIGIVLISDSHVSMSNVVVHSYDLASPGALHLIGSTLTSFDNGVENIRGPITLIGGWLRHYQSKSQITRFSAVGCLFSCLLAEEASEVFLFSPQIAWADTFSSGAGFGMVLESGVSLSLWPPALYIRNINGAGLVYGGAQVHGGFGTDPVRFVRNAEFHAYKDEFPLPISNPVILCRDGCKISLGAHPMIFTDNFGPAIQTNVGGRVTVNNIEVTDTFDQSLLSAYDGSIDVIESVSESISDSLKTYSASAPLDNSAETHLLTNGPLTVTLDPSLTTESRYFVEGLFSGNSIPGPYYVGKTFTIINTDGTNHIISLESGATFSGVGVANNGADNTLTFGTTAGGCVVLKVVSETSISVCDLGDATTSTVVRRRNNPQDQHSAHKRASLFNFTRITMNPNARTWGDAIEPVLTV